MATTVSRVTVGESRDRSLAEDDAFSDAVRDCVVFALAVTIVVIVGMNASKFSTTDKLAIAFLNANTKA